MHCIGMSLCVYTSGHPRVCSDNKRITAVLEGEGPKADHSASCKTILSPTLGKADTPPTPFMPVGNEDSCSLESIMCLEIDLGKEVTKLKGAFPQ